MGVACSQAETQVVRAPEAAEQPPQRFVDQSRKGSVATVALPQAAAAVDAQLRVVPDRRVLMAISDISELAGGSRVTPEIAFGDRIWIVRAGGKQIGTLPEMPAFADALTLLTDYARSLQPKPGARATTAAEQQRLAEFYAPSLFAAAKSIESPADLAHAGALLAYQTIDRFGIADPVFARALALVAIANSTSSASPADIGLLAASMGYEEEARAMAQKEPVAGAAGTYAAARHAVRTAGAARRLDAITRFAPALPARALPALIKPLHLSEAMGIAGTALRAVAEDVSSDTPHVAASMLAEERGAEPAKLISQFEHALPSRADALASRAFPREVIRAHYEAQFYSTLAKMFDTLRDDYGHREAAAEFVQSLGEPSSAVAKQMKEWMNLAVQTKYGKVPLPPAAAMKRVPLLGGAARAELLLQYTDAGGSTHQERRLAAYDLFPQLDSRPDELFLAGQLANRVLNDPMRRERYMEGAITRARSAGHYGLRSTYYSVIGDRARLQQLVESRELDPSDRAAALLALSKLPDADAGAITRRFEALLAEAGYDGVYSLFVQHANAHADWKGKERVIRRWFAGSHQTAGTIAAYYASSLADALERQGRYDEAWKVVQPYLKVGSANILEAAMSLMERRGDVDGALKLGREMIERYPDVLSRVGFAQMLWRRRRFEEAAELFDPSKRFATSGLQTELATAFADSFTDAQTADAVAAFHALRGAGVNPDDLTYVAENVRTAKRPALAFALASALAETQPLAARAPQAALIHIIAWDALKDAKGVDAANAWLAPRVPDEAVLQLTLIAYQHNASELVLAYGKPRSNPIKNIEVQSLLALSMLRLHVPADDPRRVALLEAVRAAGNQPSTLLPVSQYALGLIDEAALMRWPTDADGRTLVAYTIGLKAAAAGDCERSLPWMLAASTGPNDPPANWAIETLQRAAWSHRPWGEIRKNGCW